MTDAELLERARTGDDQAFAELTGPYRRELLAHCYRMLASAQDAEDAVQDTMLAAWQNLGSFEERASMRTWLYRIATNRCLNALRSASRRPAMHASPMHDDPAEPPRVSEVTWLEPYPDLLLDGIPDHQPAPLPADRDPGQRPARLRRLPHGPLRRHPARQRPARHHPGRPPRQRHDHVHPRYPGPLRALQDPACMNSPNPHRPEDSMEIGFIGAGAIASAIAGHVVSAGHPVTLANRRGPDSLKDQVTALGPLARGVSGVSPTRVPITSGYHAK